MSDGISFKSICCQNKYMQHKEYDYLIIKLPHPINKGNFYDSRIPVYTCEECKKKWAVERCVK